MLPIKQKMYLIYSIASLCILPLSMLMPTVVFDKLQSGMVILLLAISGILIFNVILNVYLLIKKKATKATIVFLLISIVEVLILLAGLAFIASAAAAFVEGVDGFGIN